MVPKLHLQKKVLLQFLRDRANTIEGGERDSSLIPPLIEDLEKEMEHRNQQLKSARNDNKKTDKHSKDKKCTHLISIWFSFLAGKQPATKPVSSPRALGMLTWNFSSCFSFDRRVGESRTEGDP